jgi:type VI secretion system secreted protein VgrG
MPPLTQEDRLLQIATTLGDNKLIVRSWQGHEAISEPFWYDVELASEDFNIDPATAIATPASLTIDTGTNTPRLVNGVINQFVLLPTRDRYAHYRARLVPWLWFLTRTSDCCIYQNLTVLEIVEAVFGKYGLTQFSPRTQRQYTPREYCVQYRETAFQFVSRLLEEEGIFYFFEHELNKHTLVLGDSSQAHSPCPANSNVRFEPSQGRGFARSEGYIGDWVRRLNVRSKQWVQTDYDFTKPSFHLTSTQPTVSTLKVPEFERFDYPGRFTNSDGAETLTRIRMEEDESQADTITGTSDCRGFAPGFTFKVQNNFRRDQNGSFLVTSVDHYAEQGSLYAGDVGGEERYSNTFTAIPSATVFHPPLSTPKPYIRGPQTAFVTGPSGEEIYVDQYGRVKVQFHWDRLGKYNESSSCWIRVASSLAGKGWGSVQLPRIGQEVIVEFLEGDPDRPLITGRVYNADHTPPYALPDNKTRSTTMTLSSPGGGGYNELRFEDKKSSEQIFLNAQRNFDLRVKNDHFATVVGESHSITSAAHYLKVGSDTHLTYGADLNQKITGTHSMQAGENWQQKVGVNYALDAGTEIHLKAGMNLVIESGANLTLKVGGNFINLNSAGVFIQGSMVMLNSGGAAGSGAGASPESPTAPKEADTGSAGSMGALPSPQKPPKAVTYSPQALALKNAHANGAPFCDT